MRIQKAVFADRADNTCVSVMSPEQENGEVIGPYTVWANGRVIREYGFRQPCLDAAISYTKLWLTEAGRRSS